MRHNQYVSIKSPCKSARIDRERREISARISAGYIIADGSTLMDRPKQTTAVHIIRVHTCSMYHVRGTGYEVRGTSYQGGSLLVPRTCTYVYIVRGTSYILVLILHRHLQAHPNYSILVLRFRNTLILTTFASTRHAFCCARNISIQQDKPR